MLYGCGGIQRGWALRCSTRNLPFGAQTNFVACSENLLFLSSFLYVAPELPRHPCAGGYRPLTLLRFTFLWRGHLLGSRVRISLMDMHSASASLLRPLCRMVRAVFCMAGKALRIR